MSNVMLLLFALAGTGLALIFFSLAVAIYLKQRHLKVIDQLVIGHEMPKELDNIFYALMRITNYGGGLSCNWCAKRSKIADKISKVDSAIKKPFQIYFWSLVCGMVILVAGIVVQNIYFPKP